MEFFEALEAIGQIFVGCIEMINAISDFLGLFGGSEKKPDRHP